MEPGSAQDFQSITEGVTGRVDGRRVDLGNIPLMRDLGIEAGTLIEEAEALRRDGQTVMFVAVDGPPPASSEWSI